MQFANLKWNNEEPYSLDFCDVYYSSDDGLAETEYVFIKHNQLVERFSSLHAATFTIIETGFGTGLNFFCTALQFLQHASSQAALRFISIERYPLKPEDFIKANLRWPMFGELATQLNTPYAILKDGLNIFSICQNRILLDLWIGDVSECLPNIKTPTDAWFLDGFAPSKNSEMWSENLFTEMARLSKSNTTFATFTSAGQVRRQLEAAGFQVSKAEGFGKKREMLHGLYR
jgi:tRNA 5-methylaminomethyl-2-thiouridine biosynthesis bifunctional protein